jgi:hypothetical protein
VFDNIFLDQFSSVMNRMAFPCYVSQVYEKFSILINDVPYHNITQKLLKDELKIMFLGREAVNVSTYINLIKIICELLGTNNRNLALLLARALEAQGSYVHVRIIL